MNTASLDTYFAQGLKAVRVNRGLTQRGLAAQAVPIEERIETVRVTISQIERGARSASREIQWLLSKALGLTPETIMKIGQGADPSQFPVSGEIAHSSQTTSEESTSNRPLVVAVEEEAQKEFVAGHTDQYRGIPLYETGKLAAGVGGLAFDPYEAPASAVLVYLPELYGHASHHLVAFRVGGDSMEPVIPQGSIVVVDQDDKEFTDAGVYVVRDGDDDLPMGQVKRVRKSEDGFVLIPENRAHLPKVVRREWRDLVVGRCVWMWRSLEGA